VLSRRDRRNAGGLGLALLHDAQGHNFGLFGLEQASFQAAGLGLWTAAFTARTPSTAAAALFALFFTFSHMSMFGAILTLVPRLIDDPDICGGAFGLDRLADQHFGGTLMAMGGGLPYLCGAAWAAPRLLARPAAASSRNFASRRELR
jgi:putative membrane protein